MHSCCHPKASSTSHPPPDAAGRQEDKKTTPACAKPHLESKRQVKEGGKRHKAAPGWRITRGDLEVTSENRQEGQPGQGHGFLGGCWPHLGLGWPEGSIKATLQGVEEGLDLVEPVRGLAGAEGHDVEVLQNLLEAGLAHGERQAAVAVEATTPDAEDGLAVRDAGGDDVAQEGLHLGQRDLRP